MEKYQEEAVKIMVPVLMHEKYGGFLLADEMGLGKTCMFVLYQVRCIIAYIHLFYSRNYCCNYYPYRKDKNNTANPHLHT